MRYVIDCSFSSALFLPDEKADEVKKFMTQVQPDEEIYIPLLWWYETLNVLHTALKRNRLKQADITNVISLLEQLNFKTDLKYGNEFSKDIMHISKLYDLTSYDATYLELAVRKKAKLMSIDEKLQKVAKEHGI